MKKTLTLLSILTVVIAGAVHAAPRSHPSELRGFETCVDAAKSEFANGFVYGSTYLIDRDGPTNAYFINASAWQAGERVLLRITCETSSNGSELLTYSYAPGRFIPKRGTVSIQVASNQ